MLVKILGTIDFIGGLILMFSPGFILPSFILIFFGAFHLIKSAFGFLKNPASWMDFSAGIVFILSIFFHIPMIICIIVGLLLIQKGIFSFL
ncbi:Uncharacterised protein [uncultured archaeon]|nr:Uncharacterised protein [uncultured archaeon]